MGDERKGDDDAIVAGDRPGDRPSRASILDGLRGPLRGMVAARFDPRLAARVDPSDVVQEALMDASAGLSGYLKAPPLPLLPWAGQFVRQRLSKLRRRHIGAAKRSVSRERPPAGGEADCVAGCGTSPSGHVAREEAGRGLREAMESLSDGDRELLRMRYAEALSVAEIAEALGVGVGAVKVRHLRALRRLRARIGDRS